jgi:chorismate mutase
VAVTDRDVQRLRAEISAVDQRVLDAVNARVELVAELKQVKEQLGLEFVDPDRERDLADALVDANGGPLSDDGVRELVRGLLELTKREVRRRVDASG